MMCKLFIFQKEKGLNHMYDDIGEGAPTSHWEVVLLIRIEHEGLVTVKWCGSFV